MIPKKLLFLLPLVLLACHQLFAQDVTYSPLFNNSTFSRSIDLSKPVGAIDGAAGTTPSGAATYTIPIKTPPGTNGMTPQLSIVYNSQGGNGILGQGWSLSGLSVITRVGKDHYHDGKVAPPTYTNEDAFVLDGQRLSPTSGSNGAPGTIYRTEAESYSVTTSLGNIGSDPHYFTVRAKDGTIMEYGFSSDSRMTSDDGSKVMVWRLNKIQDINGNYIWFTYDNTDRDSKLVKIAYTGNLAAGLSPYNEINFQYKTRADKTLSYDDGNSLSSRTLLTQVQIKGEGGEIFKTYKFTFGKNDLSFSYLKMIEEFASDNSQLNDTRFKYESQTDDISFHQSNINVDWSNPSTTTSTNYDIFSGDYDGDGKTDILRAKYNYVGSTYYHDRNYVDFEMYTKTPGVTTYHVIPGSSTVLSTSNSNYLASYQRNKNVKGYNFVHSDFNGDGKDDLLFMNISSTNTFNGVSIYYSDLGTASPGFTKTDIPAASLPAAHEMIGENILLTGDFDGDKRSDYIYMTRHTEPGTGRKYNHTFVSFPAKGENNRPIMLESDWSQYDEQATGNIKNGGGSVISKVYVIDFDGDGSSEIMCSLTDGNIIYKLQKNSSGVYYFKNLMWMVAYPIERYQDIKAVGDFNGDGKSDLFINAKATRSNWEIAYSDGKTFRVFPFSFQTGKEYQQKCVLGGTEKHPDDPNPDDLFVADFNGDGRSDILHKRAYCDADYEYKTDFVYYIANGGFTQKSYTYPHAFSEQVYPILTDENGDGKAELSFKRRGLSGSAASPDQRYMHTMYFQKDSKSHLLEKITDGFNRTSTFRYQCLPQATTDNNFYKKGSSEIYPVNNAQFPVYVTDLMWTPDGIGGSHTTVFLYENLRLHRGGRGLLGFEKVKSYNTASNRRTEATYELNRDFYVPYLKSLKTFLDSEPDKYSQSITNYNFARIESGYCFKQSNPSGSSEDLLSGRSSSYSNTYDASGNITNSTTTLSGDVTITTETATTYTAVGGSGIPNAPSEITTTTTRGSNPSVTDKTKLYYDSKGRLVHSNTDPAGVPIPEIIHRKWEYDDYGNKTKEQDACLASSYTPTTHYEYDERGRFVKKKTEGANDATALVTAYTTHHFWGKPLSVTAPTGLTATYTYDAWGRLTAETVPVTASSSYTRTWSTGWDIGTNQLYYTLAQDPSAPDVKTWFDQLGRAVKTQREHFGGAWTNSLSSYDARGNVQRTTNEHLSTETPLETVYSYDERNRVATETSIAGTITYAYTFSGGTALTMLTLSDGKIKKTKTDAGGKLIESDNGISGTVQFSYDSRGNELYARMKIFGTGTNFVSKEYDSRGRLIRLEDADAGTSTYKYDPFGRLTEQKDAKGKTTLFRYDSDLGLLQEKELDGVTTTYTYYDKSKGYRLFQEKVTGTAYGTVLDEYDYNASGALDRHSRNTNGVIMEKEFGYDSFGRLSSTIYPSGLRTRQHYRANGELEKITTNFTGGGSGEHLLYRAEELRGDGQVQKFTRSNGLQTELSYENGYLSGIRDQSGILDLAMGYDFSNGNLWARGDLRAKTQEFFTYDAADRLTSSEAEQEDASGTVWTWPKLSLEYDKLSPHWTGSYGRIVSKSDAGQYQYHFFPRNGVASITDPSGLVPHPTQQITYTAFHKTDKITDTIGGTPYEESFVYDAAEDRAYSQQAQGGTLQHRRWYMGDYERNEHTGSPAQQIHYISGDAGLSAIVVEEGGSFSYYAAYTDHLGSIVLLTDDAGTPVYRQAYDPWGRERDPQTWNYSATGSGTKPRWLTRGYTGHEMLPEYGLINMNGRLYDPLNGRMLRPDNYVQNPTNTQSYNRYSYCWNNPMKYTDPSGELVWFAPFVYAGMNLAFDMALSGGKMDIGQMATSLAMGALGGALSGASSFGTAFIGATMSQISRSIPSIPLVQSENFNLSVSPMVGFGSSGFNVGGSLNASGQIGDFAYSASVGAGYNSGMSSLGEAAGGSGYVSGGGFVGYNDGNTNYGVGYAYTAFGGKTTQGVGAITAQVGDFSLRFDEDFFGDGGDRYRTGGLLATYRANNDLTLAVGGSMMTGQADKEHLLSGGNPNLKKGTYDNCHETMFNLRGGTMYGGVIYRGQSYFAGHNSEKRLHSIQNSIHRNITKTSPYFENRAFQSKGYSYYGTYHPSYLNY